MTLSRGRYGWMALTVVCGLLTCGMYAVIVVTTTMQRRVDLIRSEIRQELVEEMVAKVDSLRMEIRNVQP